MARGVQWNRNEDSRGSPVPWQKMRKVEGRPLTGAEVGCTRVLRRLPRDKRNVPRPSRRGSARSQ